MTTPPTTGRAEDTGAADAELAEALVRYAQDGVESPVLVLLSSSRLLVPVMAAATASAPSAGGVDKDTDISAVLMQGRDGRLALLAFTSLETLRAWQPEARPVPVLGGAAAEAALAQGGAALLVDVGGPVTFVVESAELAELAAGHHLRRTSVGYAWFATR